MVSTGTLSQFSNYSTSSDSDEDTVSSGSFNGAVVPYDTGTAALAQRHEGPSCSKISVMKSTGFHVGDKMVYQGPVTINQYMYGNGAYTAIDDGDMVNNEQMEMTTTLADDKVSFNKGLVETGGVTNPGFAAEAPVQVVRQTTHEDTISGVFKGRLDTAASAATDLVQNKRFRPNATQVKILSCAVVLSVILLIALISTILLLKRPDTGGIVSTDKSVDDCAKTSDSITRRPRGLGLIIPRDIWGGLPPLITRYLNHPTPLVIIGHVRTRFCKTKDECFRIMQSMQAYYESRGIPDVGHNFIIGGDGNIYVCRGWDVENYAKKNSIIIGFLGDYDQEQLTNEMIDNAKLLMYHGVAEGLLLMDYKLVAENQTFATESPGKNIYKIIKTWPNFYPDPL